MRRVILFLLILLPIGAANAQKMHSPAEIIKTLEESKIGYQINIIDSVMDCPDRSDEIISHDYYQIKLDSVYRLRKIPHKKQSKKYFLTAESHFRSGNMDSAMNYYRLAVAADSLQFASMTYIGQIHGMRGNIDSALYWYKKVISLNYIDYMAHWLLADLYKMQNELDKACEEITIAQVLNRYNPRIKDAFDKIIFKAKRANENWCFHPEIEIKKLSDTSVYVAYTPKWMGYAMAKALWDFEPGYRESMGEGNNQFSMMEARECLACQIATMEASKIDIKKVTPFKYFLAALDKDMLDEYIIYEILLPQYPLAASNFSPEIINRIKDYVLSVRNKK